MSTKVGNAIFPPFRWMQNNCGVDVSKNYRNPHYIYKKGKL